MNSVAAAASPHEFVLTFRHELFYSNSEPVPVSDIIESLRGLERLIKLSPKALTAVTGVGIQRADVFVEQIESGSLLERLLVRLVFGTEEDALKFVDKVKANMGDSPVVNVAIGAVLLYMFYYGAQLAAPSGNTTINIHDNQVKIVNVGAGEVEMSPDSFRAAIEGAVTDKKELAASTISITKPLRLDAGASMTMDGNENLVVTPGAASEIPSRMEILPDEVTRRYFNTELQIRSTNRDSAQTGWKARLPVMSDRKLPLKIAEGIDPESIASLPVVKGDVEVVMRRSASTNQYEEHQLVLLRLSTN